MAALPENDRIAGPFIAVAGQTDFPADFPLIRAEALRARIARDGVPAVVLMPPDVTAHDRTGAGFTARLGTAAEAADKVWVYSELPAARLRQHTPNGAIRTLTLEDDATEFQAQQQEVRRDLGRAVMVDPGETPPSPEDVKNAAGAGKAAADAKAAAEALASSRATLTLSNVAAAEARRNLRLYYLTPEDFGGTPNDPSFDNTAAINTAETAAAVLGIAVQFREGADYYFKGTLLAVRNRLTWRGNRSRLIYNGANTTRNLLELGDGVETYREQVISGLEIASRTIMTSGWAVWAPRVVRSTHWFDNIQGQDFCEENVGLGINPSFYGITLWGGYWADRVDNVRMHADAINARETGWKVNGVAGAPQADFWPIVGKVSWARVGGHMAGGFGGLYLTPNTTLIHNRINLLVDQAEVAEANRELFATGAIFDVAEGNSLTTEANVVIDDPGAVRINFANCWLSAGQSHGFWVKRHGGVLTITGGRVIQMVGDGFRTDQAGSGFALITGVQITNCGGWGVNGRVNGYSVAVDGCQMFANTAGDVRQDFTNTGVSESQAADFLKVLAREIVADGPNGITAKFGFVSDQFHYITRLGKDVNGVGGDPQSNYDDQDYDLYVRAENRREWYVGSQRIGHLTGDGYLSLGGGPETQQQVIVTTTNGSGNVSVAHGVTSGVNRILGATVRVGADGAAKATFNASWDGTTIGVNATGQPNTKAVITMVIARNDT